MLKKLLRVIDVLVVAASCAVTLMTLAGPQTLRWWQGAAFGILSVAVARAIVAAKEPREPPRE